MGQRTEVFFQLWTTVITHTMAAGIASGAAFGVIVLSFGFVSFVSSPQDLIQLVFLVLVGTFAGVVVGALFGLTSGIVVGIIGGWVSPLITALFFYPPRKSLVYPLIVHVANLVATVSVVNAVLGTALNYSYAANYYPIFNYIPIILASLSSYLVIRRMSRRYLKSRAHVALI